MIFGLPIQTVAIFFLVTVAMGGIAWVVSRPTRMRNLR